MGKSQSFTTYKLFLELSNCCNIIESRNCYTIRNINYLFAFLLILHASFCPMSEYKRIYQKCEGGIENSVSRINVWHHEACRLMTNNDQITRNGFFYPILIQIMGSFSCSPFQKFLNMQRCYISRSSDLNITMTSLIFQHAAIQLLSFPRFGTRYIFETENSLMGRNSGARKLVLAHKVINM